jgi:hypothetical protein
MLAIACIIIRSYSRKKVLLSLRSLCVKGSKDEKVK